MGDKRRIAYLCDWELNNTCSKIICAYGEIGDDDKCYCTCEREFAKLNKNGEPIVMFQEESRG